MARMIIPAVGSKIWAEGLLVPATVRVIRHWPISFAECTSGITGARFPVPLTAMVPA